MKLGMSLPQAGSDATPDNIAMVARRAEEIGLDSLWVLDRLFRPRHPISKVPGQEAQPLPELYASVLDPIETLTYVAALTSRVQLGTSVILSLLHAPVVLAKRLATLDHLSAGRVIAGIGMGWMPDEFKVAMMPMTERGARMEEHLAAMRAVWSADPVEVGGRFYTVPTSDIGPKPASASGIPVIIGCYAAAAITRAGRVADGFNPLATTRDALERDVSLFRSAAREAGRDPETLQIVVRANATPTDHPSIDDTRPLFGGTLNDWIEDLAYLTSLGIDHTFFALNGPIDNRLMTMEMLRERVR